MLLKIEIERIMSASTWWQVELLLQNFGPIFTLCLKLQNIYQIWTSTYTRSNFDGADDREESESINPRVSSVVFRSFGKQTPGPFCLWEYSILWFWNYPQTLISRVILWKCINPRQLSHVTRNNTFWHACITLPG